MTDIDSASQDSLETLRQETDGAHAAYSAAYHQREDAEAALKNHGARCAALRRELKKTQAAIEARLKVAVEKTITEPASANLTEVSALRAKWELLGLAIRQYTAWGLADGERQVLESRVNELVFQLNFERLRQEHHDQTVVLNLARVMETAGEFSTGGLGEVSAGMQTVIHEIAANLTAARDALKRHDHEAAEARADFERTNTWTHAKP